MTDKLLIENGKIVLTTEEGQQLERSEATLVEMLRDESVPPLRDMALPDGIKFVQWRQPFLAIVHQFPPHVRKLRWISNESPKDYGPGTEYRTVRISIPYALTFAVYYRRGDNLTLTGYNELYFRNEPLRHASDRVCYPALLNISAIRTSKRIRAWICTQYLQNRGSNDWTRQLAALLDHTWNGGFNLSSEHNEGASWYGESKGVHPKLHPIEKWEKATKADEAFALSVPWKPVPTTVGELMEAMLAECERSGGRQLRQLANKKPPSIVQRFINFAQAVGKKTA